MNPLIKLFNFNEAQKRDVDIALLLGALSTKCSDEEFRLICSRLVSDGAKETATAYHGERLSK